MSAVASPNNVVVLRPAQAMGTKADLATIANTINTTYVAASTAALTAVDHARNALALARECGLALIQAKGLVAHGEWAAWIKTNCPNISDRTVRDWMRVAGAELPPTVTSVASALRFLAPKKAKRQTPAGTPGGSAVDGLVMKANTLMDHATEHGRLDDSQHQVLRDLCIEDRAAMASALREKIRGASILLDLLVQMDTVKDSETVTAPTPTSTGSRRKQPPMVETTVEECVADAYQSAQDLRDELQDWYDNLPPAFQDGIKGEDLQTAIDSIGQYCDDVPEVPDALRSLTFQYVPPSLRRASRRTRMDHVVEMLRQIQERLSTADSDASRALAATLDDAMSDWESVEFPGAYG